MCFAGPHMEPQKLKNSLQTKGLDDELDETFRLTPGEGGGDNRSFVTVVMSVSPENIQRLLRLQKELAPRGYPLDPEHTQVWSFQRTPETRRQVQVMVPKFLREVTAKFEKALPNAKVSDEKSAPRNGLAPLNTPFLKRRFPGMCRDLPNHSPKALGSAHLARPEFSPAALGADDHGLLPHAATRSAR